MVEEQFALVPLFRSLQTNTTLQRLKLKVACFVLWVCQKMVLILFRVKHEEGIPGSDFDAEPIQTALEKNKTLQHLHLIVSSNDRDEFSF